ncbi:MAG: tyrosine-type recombinase/integrase [Steroidobacteraceae bacterium]
MAKAGHQTCPFWTKSAKFAAVGRKRKIDKHLPRRVYLRRGTYFFVDAQGTWRNLGRDLPSMYREMAKLTEVTASLRTMADLFDRYVREVLPGLASRTQSDYLGYLENLSVVFGSAPPREVTAGHVSDYQAKRAERSVVQANREKSCLSAVFTAALKWHAVESNPCRLIPKLREAERNRYVTDEEFNAVYRLASPMLRCAMDLATMTGQREGDLLRLSRAHLGDDGILFAIGKSKRRHPRHGKVVETAKRLIVEWSPELRAVIERLKKLGPDIRPTLLCTLQGKPFTSDGFRSNWHRLISTATSPGQKREPPVLGERFTFHDLRAKSASDDAFDVATERLAHDDPRTTQKVYRRKPRRARPGAKILDASGDIGQRNR